MKTPGWRIAASSVIGTRHTTTGMPCQDSHLCHLGADDDGHEVAILLASDGAGSAARSDIGSAVACAEMMACIQGFLTDGGRVDHIDPTLCKSWLHRTRRAIEEQAFSDAHPFRDYACTLLLAVVAQEIGVFFQIGDGAIVVDDDVTSWNYASWPQKGEFANTTTFVTSDDAVEAAQYNRIDRRLREVSVFTDGIENLVLNNAERMPHPPFFNSMFATLRSASGTGVVEQSCEGLSRYLSLPRVCERTDDDKTLILATRRNPLLPMIIEAV